MGQIANKLREVEFSYELRGYSRDEVDEFLEQEALEIEHLEQELVELKKKVAELEALHKGNGSTANGEPRQMDEAALTETMSKALLLAQKTADSLVEDAKQRARELVEKAQMEANRLETETRRRLEQEVEKLQASKAILGKEVEELTNLIAKEREELAGALIKLAEWVKQNLGTEKLKQSVDAKIADKTVDSSESSAQQPTESEKNLRATQETLN